MSSEKIEILKKRSQAFQKLRAFFYVRDVYEVDTPILSQSATPDVHLRSLNVSLQLPGHKEPLPYYLHTSPEYPMKRLLCEGSGDIFYLGKVFRDGDLSTRHQPEFTLLEWYRQGFDLQQMMHETAEVVRLFIGEWEIEFVSYEEAFLQYAGLEHIHGQTAVACRDCLIKNHIPEVIGVDLGDKALWEQLVLTEVIEPQLGQNKITCLYHYPAREAALAHISDTNPLVSERFEVFVNGMELANGYKELQAPESYQERFEKCLKCRIENGLPEVPIDDYLIQTLHSYPLPDCSGVALGFDRLFALSLGKQDISQVITFSIEKA